MKKLLCYNVSSIFVSTCYVVLSDILFQVDKKSHEVS